MIKPLGIGAGLLAIIASSGFAQNTTGPTGQPLFWKNITDNSQYVGKTCIDYNTGLFNAITGDIIRCTRSAGFTSGLTGNYVTVSGGGGGGGSIWGGITGTLSNQTDLQTALNGKQNTLTLPLSVANGGTGTTTPSLIAGANVTITGTWPNQTIASTGGGGTGTSYTFTSPLSLSGTTVSLLNSGVSAGSYTSANITVDALGRVTAASNGTGGGGGISSGTALPGTCTVGTPFIKTNGGPNQQFYICSATNTWTLNLLLGGSGALGIDGITGALDIVTSVVPRTSAANAFTGRNSFTLSNYVMQGVPSAPGAGLLTLYANNDGSLHYINSAGTDSALATGAGFANPMTTQDDVIVGGASGTPARLAKGADSQVLGIDPGTHHLAYINQSGSGGSGTPGGSSGQFQYNNGGAFGGLPVNFYNALGPFNTNTKYAFNAEGDGGATLPAGATEPDAILTIGGYGGHTTSLSLANWQPDDFSQVAFWSAVSDTLGHFSHRYQVGVGGNDVAVVNNKWFVYDAGSCTGTPSVCENGDQKGFVIIVDGNPATPVTTFKGVTKITPQSLDPSCSTSADSGKQWMDNTDTNNHHFKVCSVTGGTAAWVTVF